MSPASPSTTTACGSTGVSCASLRCAPGTSRVAPFSDPNGSRNASAETASVCWRSSPSRCSFCAPPARTRFTPLVLRQEERLLQDMMNGGEHDREAANPLHRRIEEGMAPIGAAGNRPHVRPSYAGLEGVAKRPDPGCGNSATQQEIALVAEMPRVFSVEPTEPGARQNLRHGYHPAKKMDDLAMPYERRVSTAGVQRGSPGFIMIDISGTRPSSAASSQNASGKPAACATNPIAAGPVRMPAYPTVVMAATASPAGIALCDPACRNNTGTMLEAPKPIKRNPASATAGAGASRSTTRPATAIKPPHRSVP